MSDSTSSDNLISNGSAWSLNTVFKQGYFGNVQPSLSWGMSETNFPGRGIRYPLPSFFPKPHVCNLEEQKMEFSETRCLYWRQELGMGTLKWGGIERKLRGEPCRSGATCFLFHHTAISSVHLILSYFLSLNPISSQLRMGWPWISLSLLNSFFLNWHFVVEQMNPSCEKNSSHAQRMKSWLIKERHYSFLAQNTKIAFPRAERELKTLTKDRRKTSWVTRKVITRQYYWISCPVPRASFRICSPRHFPHSLFGDSQLGLVLSPLYPLMLFKNTGTERVV